MNRWTRICCVLPALALAGCAAATPPAKDGGAARAVTLSAVAYTTNTLTGETLDRFVDDVATTSDGAVTLELGPAVDAGAQDGSASVIDLVRDGTADIGVVAARTFDLQGATSLQALGAPLLVESPAQAAAFLSDPVTDQMLAGLDDAGVVGLALTYDQLRQPLGFAGPLDPRHLDGAVVLARPSRAMADVVAALGASADPRNGDAAAAAIQSGEVVGAETSMDRPSGPQSSVGQSPAITGNVQLAIKANVIIANPKVWDGLSADQRAALRDAASATRAWAGQQLVPLATAAPAFCAEGNGDVVVADAAELAAWHRALDPVVAELAAADPATAAAVARMRQIVAGSPTTDRATPCTMARDDQLPTVTPEGDQSVVAGQWRLLVSPEKLAAAGASNQDVALNKGAWTITFDGEGGYSFAEPRGRTCPGTYAVAGDRLSMVEDHSVGDCDGGWELTFTRDGDRMTWTPTPEFAATWPPLAGFFANPVERIGDPPK